MDKNNELPSSPTTSQPKKDCLSQIVFFLAWSWVITASLIRLGAEYIAYSMYPSISPAWRWALPVGQTVAITLPVIFLAIWWKNTRYRGIFQAWLLASWYGLASLPSRLVRDTDAQLQALLQIFLGTIFILLVLLTIRILRQRQGKKLSIILSISPGAPLFGSLLVGGLLAIPWLLWGALGSPLDTLLQGLQAVILGVAASFLLEFFIYQPLVDTSTHKGSNFLLGGLSSGAVLLSLASLTGFPFGGMQLLVAASCSGLGWMLTALRLSSTEDKGHSWLFQAVLVSLVAAAPALFFDADELLLVIGLGAGELLKWAYQAAAISWLLARALGLLAFIALLTQSTQTQNTQNTQKKFTAGTTLLAGLALAAWVMAFAFYFIQGQPGFFGETLFVILKEQADLSSAVQIADPLERRAYVYDTLTTHANRTQAELRQVLDRVNISFTPYYLENAIEVNGGPLLRTWLELRPEVDRVLDNPWLRPLPETRPINSGSYQRPASSLWNLSLIGADRVWSQFGVTGEGIIIGQSDSGVELNHPELSDSYRGNTDSETPGSDYNWLDSWYQTPLPVDFGGHGTHTLGSILGKHTGVAPGATWIACVNLSRNLGNPALYLDCMQFMLAPFPTGGDPLSDGDPARGANVINNSWGCPDIEGCDTMSLQPAVAALRTAGVFVVASAGNDGPRCSSLQEPLAIYDESYTVGAVGSSGDLANFSSIGPVTIDGSQRIKPDITAPGVDVFSSTPNGTYDIYSGTSMAGPHVVGVVALMWSANPALIGDIERTEEILRLTATPYTGALPVCPGAADTHSTAVGYGIVNAFEAVRLAMESMP